VLPFNSPRVEGLIITKAQATQRSNMQDEQGKATTIDAAELPFLVTHWLSNFQASSSSTNANTNTNPDALQRIHQAAAEMASAFSDLGAFGTANQVSFV
jgi:hypothetical protein